MKKLTTNFLKTNPTGTVCGIVGNKALSNSNVIDFIDKYFGNEIFVKMTGEDFYEIRTQINNPITKQEFLDFCEKEGKKLTDKVEELNVKASNDDIIGFIFEYLVEKAEGSVKYKEGYLDEDGMLLFEIE